MKFTKGKKIAIGIIIGILLSITTIYAAPNVQQQLVLWGQQKSNDAKLQVQTTLHDKVENQLSKLSDDNNSNLSQIIKKLERLSEFESIKTFNSINASLDVHMKEIEDSADILNNGIMDDFKQIVEKVNTQTDGVMKSIEYEDYQNIFELEDKKTEIDGYQEGTINSNHDLDIEIQLTQSTINELEEIMENEPNQAIRDYIQKKINFLNELVYEVKSD